MRISAGNYFGSKNKHLDFIGHLLPQTKVYVEPFGGSAAVLLNRPRSEKEVYNDLYRPVVCLMKALRDRPEELVQAMELTPYSRSEFYETYPEMGAGRGDLEVARHLVVRMLQGVGAYAATKADRSGWGRMLKDSTRAPKDGYVRRNFTAAGERLQGVAIHNADALAVIEKYDSPDTLFYVDPPYVLSVRNNQEGYVHELPDDGQAKLAAALNAAQGMVAVSGYLSPLYEELYAGWNVYEDQAKALAPNVKTATIERTEAVWTSYDV